MGSHNTKHKSHYGKMHIETKDPYTYSGETVEGAVYLDLQEDFPGAELNLKISGVEETEWEEEKRVVDEEAEPQENGLPVYKTIVEEFEGEKTFYKNKVKMFDFEEKLEAGQYTFPFSFKLKKNLPNSFKYKQDDFYAEVKYKIKAELEDNAKQGMVIKSKQDLVVREPLESVEAKKGEEVAKAMQWCCIPAGEAKIKVYFDRNAYQQGEKANIVAEVDNSKCGLDIPNLFVTLGRNLTVKDKEGHCQTKSDNVCTKDYDGVKGNHKATDDKAMKLEFKLKDKEDGDLEPSCNGHLIHCHYTLNVYAPFDAVLGCCGNTPNVMIPVTVFSAPPIGYGEVKEPEGWNPKKFEMKVLSVDESSEYSKKGPKKKKSKKKKE